MIAREDTRRAIHRLNRIGLAAIVLLIGGFGGWASTSRLSGAVIASGTIVVESSVKKVQHPTGGIVREIMVKEGDEVEGGEIVMRLDDTLTRATLGIVRSQLDELTARYARLIAERDGADELDFAEEILARANEKSVAVALAGERKLFESRRLARTGQSSQLRKRIGQIEDEIRGLTAQQQAKSHESKLIGEELVGVTDLFQKNLISVQRYMQLRRDQARLDGERGQLIADGARARGKASEIELQIIQIEQDFRTEVLKELREAEGRISELKERRTAAEDQLKRVDIRAPQTGLVHQLAVHTVGGVVANGETIMLIVPRHDSLVVEAKVAPQDIDQIVLGAMVAVRVRAGNPRTIPDVNGAVTRISADLTREPQANLAYYLIRVTLPESEVRRLGDLKLVPGMPAEAYVQTGERTPLQFLFKPLQEQIARTFRER